MAAEAVIHREEAVGLPSAIADILEEVKAIRDYLEDGDGEEENQAD